ncbi:DUF3817 domain-containing protein [Ahrensia kielensis]|uniref:DUF3817 domain-containing protein n=1 Tax=Ahrensia kielensis TaxID=76980 RepID=A0ABU9T2G3_9HYPH
MIKNASYSPDNNMLEVQQLKRLELMSLLEATTLTLLVFFMVPAKYFFDWPLGSRILGPIHGLVFLVYVWTVLQTVAGGGWMMRDVARLVLVAFIPLAGFFNIPWLRLRAVADLQGQEA